MCTPISYELSYIQSVEDTIMHSVSLSYDEIDIIRQVIIDKIQELVYMESRFEHSVRIKMLQDSLAAIDRSL